ncbi:MAG: Crp/Fnr family transcriptional regulator [Nitrospira sp.]|jgi:CRP-like cAMP-binding protein|nr:Crp/Fnr family transcriptional regulator [Nitrospira sp.]
MKLLPPIDLCLDCPVEGNCALVKADSLPPLHQTAVGTHCGLVTTYRSGEFLSRQNTRASHALMICRGVVAMVVFTADGEEILLEALGPGHLVGFSDWLQRTRTDSLAAKAVTDVTIRSVTVDDPLTLLRKNDEARTALLEQTRTHITTAQRAMIGLRGHNARAHMLLAIHELTRLLRLKRNRPVIIPHKIPRWFFSAYTGLRPETVSRILSRLQHEGLIARRDGRLAIPDFHKLGHGIRQYSSFLFEHLD